MFVVRACLLGLLAAWVVACQRPEPPAELPAGASLAGDAAALRRVLQRLEHRGDIPLGRAAQLLLERIEGCQRIAGHVPDGSWDALPASVSCVEQIDPRLAALQSDADLVLTLVREDVGTLTASARVDAGGGLVADASLAFGGRSLVAELMLPGERPPGPAVLNADDTLVHARLRPAGGLNIARLVPHGSQGDQLFRLKSELFAGVVLDGSWEVAVYLPEPGAIVPPAALAVGYRVREAALAAAEEFVAQLRSNWPIQQVPRAFGDAQGVCLQDLKILPALEPCYVATDDALIVGWNPASLSQALARGSVAGPSDGLIVRLDRFAEADARLQGAAGNGDLVHDYAWERLEAYPEARDDRLHLRVELIAGGAS